MISATVTGNLGRDAEVRQAGSGTVCGFSVGSSAGRDKPTTWVRCSLWGKRGESLGRYLTKGTRVAVVGELTTREHDGKTYLELRVADIDLMGGGERGQGRQQSQPRDDDAFADRVSGGAGEGESRAFDEEDIPF